MTTGNDPVFAGGRPSYFANRVLRLVIKTALAQTIGTDCLALLTVIAMTEDARRYRGPVTFWNSQLLPLVGFSKWERLDKARKAVMDAGWLAYEPGGRHRPGIYRVTIPAELQEVEDAAVDEGSIPSRYPLREVDADTDADTKPESSGVSRGVTSLPKPKTKKPSRKPASAVVTVEFMNEFSKAWHDTDLRAFREFTDKRRAALRHRLGDPEWASTWREALQRAAESSFCRGHNERGWKADVDWFLKPDAVTKLLEGNYDNPKRGTGSAATSTADDVMKTHTARVLAEKRAEQVARQAARDRKAK